MPGKGKGASRRFGLVYYKKGVAVPKPVAERGNAGYIAEWVVANELVARGL